MRLGTVLLLAFLALPWASCDLIAADTSPELAEVMARIQLQHAKLWFAGKLNNWGLAEYEAKQIEKSLDAAGIVSGERQSYDRSQEQLRLLKSAIHARDAAAFTSTYAALTNACNGCHRSAGYAAIAIQRPLTMPVPNQSFTDQVSEGHVLANASCGMCHVMPGLAAGAPASRPTAPAFAEILDRPAFSSDDLRRFLASSHRLLGPDQTMRNPRLTDYQIELIIAYVETLRAERSRGTQ